MKKIKRFSLIIISIIVWLSLWWYVFGVNIWNIFYSENRDTSQSIYKKTDIDMDNLSEAYFAWGCFWCMEGIFESQEWVSEAISGYIGGSADTAEYSSVSSGVTNHREAVQILYDPNIIEYSTLVELYWTQIDPVDAGGQFADRGFHYTTAIYYSDEWEKNIAEASKQALGDSGKFEQPIATLILPVSLFYRAEEYHQDYYKKSSLRYNLYKKWSWRADFIDENWKDRIAEINKSTYWEEALRKRLTPLQYKVTQEWGTEKPFDNEYWDNKEPWIYVDIIDGAPLYSSTDKYVSGTGWPSFTKPISEEVVTQHEDTKLFYTRTEIKSASSNSHLGHVFSDGPKESGWLRYCMNSAAMRFIPLSELEEQWYWKYIWLFEEK